MARERRYSRNHRAEKKRRRAVEKRAMKWIDLDENVAHGYILIDDKNLGPGVPEIDSEEAPFPEDAVEYDDENDNDDDDDDDDDDHDDDDDDSRDENVGSHSRREWSMYKQLKKNIAKRYRCDLDLGVTYPLANSHGNAYQDSSSHSKYTELYSEFRAKNNPDASHHDLDATSTYSVANSHGEHNDRSGLTTDVRERAYRESSESDNLAWDTRQSANYEIANSHSNYRVFYDSQTQNYASGIMPPWSSELWPENRREEACIASNDFKDNNARKESDDNEHKASADQSEKKIENEQDSGTTCDIEQCLVQIEESLLNIEQNLLHVQDLDIPELRNLLYKSPSIERSLFEVQDLLYADGIVPVISRKSMSLDSDEEEEDEEEEEEEEVWVGQNLTIKDNDNEDGDASAPLLNEFNEESCDTINVDEQNPSKSTDDHNIDWVDGSNDVREEEKDSSLQMCAEKTMDFVPNSLNKTMPRRIVLDEVKENIRLCPSESEEGTITIDYNLNSACAEKKSCRDKWHSRTNSLDENSIFQNSELGDKQENGKSSLQNIFLESTSSCLIVNAKARSEGTLQTNPQDKPLRRNRAGSHEELLQAVEATAEDFRKRLESFASQRRSMLDRQKKATPKPVKEVSDSTASRSRDKSPVKQVKRATATTASKSQEKDNGAGKSGTGCDKRKKKKTSGKGASDNALVPSKLISLSLSLLLAALLQAVRCLTDLVEDAFRSVSYDRSGLLQ